MKIYKSKFNSFSSARVVVFAVWQGVDGPILDSRDDIFMPTTYLATPHTTQIVGSKWQRATVLFLQNWKAQTRQRVTKYQSEWQFKLKYVSYVYTHNGEKVVFVF